MGFPSPATDYVEHRLTPERICNVGMDSRILETSSGFAVIEPVTRLVQNQVLLILIGGRTQFARVMGRALITDDGEAIEGGCCGRGGSDVVCDVLHQQCDRRRQGGVMGGITPPCRLDSPPTTASFLCVYRDTEHGCKYRAQIRRWHVPVVLQ